MTDKEFNALVEANKSNIWRLCRMYAKDMDTCKDLFQDVLVEVWKSLKLFKGDSKIETWIYRVTVNTCIRMSLRLKKYEREISLDEFAVNLQTLPDNGNEKYEALYHCIGRLNTIDKTLVGLFLEELPYKEIASVMGINENHVAVKISRVKKALFTCLSIND
jgi:RNA polymerase sigma factor (sigma-70 family)